MFINCKIMIIEHVHTLLMLMILLTAALDYREMLVFYSEVIIIIFLNCMCDIPVAHTANTT